MAYDVALYRHDLDQRAFEALNTFPKLVKLRESYMENVDEKAIKIDLLSMAIRLSENQFPEVYRLLPSICEKLGIAVPELYYAKSNVLNAWTCGSTNPYIVVTSKLVNKLSPDLLSSVLAHECGHIACKHCLYHSMAGLLVDGIENSLLSTIPAVRKYLTPTLVRSLLFWDRCSELSADRAAALCDGNSSKTVDVLLRIHGYDHVNREEFLKQAVDLNAFVHDSKSNQLMELMLIKDETHPRLATRAYECDVWTKTDQFKGILDGTYTLETMQKEQEPAQETEVITAQVQVETQKPAQSTDLDELNRALNQVDSELERYTNKADKADYAFAVASGILAGALDSLYVGETVITGSDIALSHEQVNHFIEQYARENGIQREHLQNTIGALEEKYKVAQDNVWKGASIGVSARNHHLADLAHHPTPLGLVSAIIVQFFRIGTFVNRDGEWHFVLMETSAKNMVEIWAPAVLTGILNWLAAAGETKWEEAEERELPKALHTLVHFAASAPMIVEVAKCANNWFGHLVSDMGGSKNTAGGGMGIPGVFLSMLYEIAALPGLKDSGLPHILDGLYQKQKLDLRHEIPLYKAAGKQAVPVAFNEVLVRAGYFVSHLVAEFSAHEDLGDIDWNGVIPFRNRTVDRMLAVSYMTFTVADTADSAVRAAIESGGNWVLFSGRFVTRFNYVGAGRAAVAVVKEISNEQKETQLIHEKMILSEEKAEIFLSQLQQFKAQLEEKVSNYLAEDIEAFMEGFTYMDQGFASGDSDLVIKGNVVIQRVLGREPQFTNQKEFDALMESDLSLQL